MCSRFVNASSMIKDSTFTHTLKLKILMIAPGGDIHSLRPLNSLIAKGCRVVFCDARNPFPQGRDGYKFVRFPYPRGRRWYPRVFGNYIGARILLWIVALRLKLLWRRVRPEIVHIHWIDDHAYYCAKARFHPLILTAWGSDINNHFLTDADAAYRRRIGEAIASADLVIADSADLLKKCSELAGRNIAKIQMLPGVDTNRFHRGYAQAVAEWRRRLNIPANAMVLISIRGWSPLYRHGSILEAFARALPRLTREVVLVFKILRRAGTDRALYEKEIRALAEKLKVDRVVRWMEEVPLEQLPEVYSFADVIMNYPTMDAFPVTFLEAAACECPVISCRLPSYVGTFAEDYFCLVSPDSVSELSDAIVDFVNNRPIAYHSRLSELRRMVCRDYNETMISERLLEIYRGFLSAS